MLNRRDPETFVGWAMIILALVVAAMLLAPDVLADEFKWEPVPGAKPCAPSAVKWMKVPWPIPSGQEAEVKDGDYAQCTIISGYSVEDAKILRAAGPFSDDPTTIYDHEMRHLLRAERHPAGQALAGWGRTSGPPELDSRLGPRQ